MPTDFSSVFFVDVLPDVLRDNAVVPAVGERPLEPAVSGATDPAPAAPPVRARAARVLRPIGQENEALRLRFATQPIVDRSGRVVASELLFRWNSGNRPVTPDLGVYATATALSHALLDGQLLAAEHVCEHPIGDLLVNMDQRTLMSPIVEAMTPDVGVIELLETVEVDDALIARIRELHRRGYRFAIDDVISLDDPRWALARWVQFIKVDVMDAPAGLQAKLIRRGHQQGLAVIAEKIESAAEHARLMALGVDFFQGYHIAQPHVHAVKALPGCPPGVLGELYLMARAGASLDAMALLAVRHPAVTARLLLLQQIHAPQYVSTCRSMGEVLASLPRAVLIGWLSILNISATHGRDQALATSMREQLDLYRQQIRRDDRAGSIGDMERLTFRRCHQLLRLHVSGLRASAAGFAGRVEKAAESHFARAVRSTAVASA